MDIEEYKLNFIPDEELDLTKKPDLLGTNPYVETLYKTIKNCESSFTIGLFGRWGSGKSTIINTLINKFEQDEQIKFIKYDAWKYSHDSFRRCFLLELSKEFSKNQKSKLNKDFYCDKESSFNWISLVVSIIVSITIGILLYYVSSESESKSIIISSLLPIMNIITQIWSSKYKKTRITEPERFEKCFNQIISEIKKQKKYEKIVIAIDNIDRCHKELVFELLITIKNFMGKNGVVFIIPIDDEALKQYLQLKEEDANEFIRKIFNTYIFIKNYSFGELQDYAIKLNKKYELRIPNNLLSIISNNFTKNPRRMIQFLNNFQLERLNFDIRDKSNRSNSQDKIDNKHAMLAKAMLIKEEWPELYNRLCNDPYLLNRISKDLIKKKFEILKGINDETGNKTDAYEVNSEHNLTISDECLTFFYKTRFITTDNPRQYFINNNLFNSLPIKLEILINNGKLDGIDKYYTEPISKFLDFLSDKIERDVIINKNFNSIGINIIKIIIDLFNNDKFNNEVKTFYNQPGFNNIKTIFKDKELINKIYNFKSEKLIKFGKWLLEKNEKDLIVTCAGTINNLNPTKNMIPTDEINENHIQFVKDYILILKDKELYLEGIAQTVTSLIVDKNKYDEFKDILKDEKLSFILISKEKINHIINSININNMNEEDKIKWEIIKAHFKNDNNNPIYKDFINKIINLLPTKIPLEIFEIKLLLELFLEINIIDDNYRSIINEFLKKMERLTPPDEINLLIQRLRNKLEQSN